MKQYLELLQDVLANGDQKDDRTGVGTRSVFGRQIRFDLRNGFPAVTTKKLAWKAVVSELLWFIEGSNDERRLAEILHGTRDADKKTVWTANAQADYWKPKAQFDGDCGQIYGKQWRSWGPRVGTHIDQLGNVIESLKKDKFSRRHIVVAYNPGEINDMCLPPCHAMFQFYVNSRDELSCQLYQRSADAFLGVPFNIASYALLTRMVAQVCKLKPGEFVHTFGDLHIYNNHIDQVKEQIRRQPLQLPKLYLNAGITDINKFTMDDIILDEYQSHPAIKAEMAV